MPFTVLMYRVDLIGLNSVTVGTLLKQTINNLSRLFENRIITSGVVLPWFCHSFYHLKHRVSATNPQGNFRYKASSFELS